MGYGEEAPLLTASEPHGAVVGSEFGDVQVSQHVQVGLSAGIPYHYRVVAVSEIEVAPENSRPRNSTGPTRPSRPRPAGAFALPDGRAWEMVSPPDKHGALIAPISQAAVIQASADGSAMTYQTDRRPKLNRRVTRTTCRCSRLAATRAGPRGTSRSPSTRRPVSRWPDRIISSSPKICRSAP